ncbi:MAG: deoxyribodipyrimidine photolyase [Acidobacteriota bacterium]
MQADEIATRVPTLRLRAANDRPVREDGDFVLYWMIAYRRTTWNFAFDRAVDWAKALDKPVLVFEPLRSGYRWASDRIHRFVIDGMVANGARLAGSRVGYFPYLEPENGAGQGLFETLAERAAVVVTDDFPCFFLPRMVAAAADRLPVLLESVDGNGVLPMRATEKVFLRAVDFRRFLQKTLPAHLGDRPRQDPLTTRGLPEWQGPLPEDITDRWPPMDLGNPPDLADFPIDHEVPPVSYSGGSEAAAELLDRFLEERLDRYQDGRRDVIDRATSELSPYLHFGHISVHEVFSALADREDWTPDDLAPKATGSRSGWWGMGENAESFLDELLTWREVGYNMACLKEDYTAFDSLPAWAIETLEEHAGDDRPEVYTREEFEGAKTEDELWNAAQRELIRDGRIHNYLRMLWGKKILEWSATPRDALDVMIELNNKYALDGRNPNSYSGIFWCLGRYDRPWGPERPIFGKIRFMSTASTRRKLDADAYEREFGIGRLF